MGSLARVKAIPDEWGPAMYGLLSAHGIRPWEFGEMTFPWLGMIFDKGEVRESDESLRHRIKQSRSNMAKFLETMKERK